MDQNLRNLSDEDLLDRTRSLAAKERETAIEVLWHLKEVSERRLYSARGFSSIFSYAVHELKYSEAAAARRVAAMRLLSQVPEVATQIETGALNLSSVSAAQNFFKREETEQGKVYTTEEKREILESMAHQPKRECEKILAALSPESILSPERVKPLTENHTELRIIVTEETLQKVEKLRNLLAHQNPNGSYATLIDLMAEIALDQVDPERIEERIQRRKARRKTREKKKVQTVKQECELGELHELGESREFPRSPESPESPESKEEFPTPLAEEEPSSTDLPTTIDRPSCRISAPIRREVFLRDRGCCTYQDPVTGRVCGSRFQVQPDHIRPVALGGSSEPDNLQLRCKSHNLWEAISKLGKQTMAPFIQVR